MAIRFLYYQRHKLDVYRYDTVWLQIECGERSRWICVHWQRPSSYAGRTACPNNPSGHTYAANRISGFHTGADCT